jgi:hypothetical protein
MDRQLDMRVERRIRLWILEQELEQRREPQRPAPTSQANQNRQ